MEYDNKDYIKSETEDLYVKLITVIEERINSFVFENTDTGRIFFEALKFYNIPDSEGFMSAMLFNLYEDYKKVKNENYFDDFLNDLMTFYCELITKYEEETIELNRTLQATELDKKLHLGKITKRLSKKISEYDEVICYLQYELNRYEVYNDMSLTNINKKEEKPTSPTSNKIQVKGSLQSIGFIFSELIDKGYIEVPKRNGNPNTSAISRMILKHFEFVDREKQPKAEGIRQSLFSKNSLSADKQALFKIPESNTINTD